ncbi:MAG: tRNA uridine-5-carboxymethylaminomethyl(34) synthesis GTPase MnmE [Gammaproteobacteria bacterium]|nr:tRNA uridine-5-carboxymethylaminomethyl(34) synthesis GTPase MnmE [Gammaproteobacteria bacterium]MDH5344906.1 tRNA uridine-5-carboxymethylaminomethyl(34) synthesis GTPase MnmE [Gammaproteobacteria bacterium]
MGYARDTIAAVATPPGRGGIGIVRISGPAAAHIAARMLGSVPPPRYATCADFHDEKGTVVDSGIALWFPEPDSFTGESVLELHGHGGPAVTGLIVTAALHLGARRAEPGEFSKRAFLNGKLDLVQAEAVADLIDSGTAQAARAAHRSLAGAFSAAVDDLGGELIKLRMHVEAAIDFPEEEIDFLADEALGAEIVKCANAFGILCERAHAGRLLRDGIQVVIIGRPNAGKSSLLNRLCGHDAAIVTEVAGTTRDILREHIDIDGLAVELIDTAGLRDDPGIIEAEGIRRAQRALANADAVLFIRDATEAEAGPPGETLPDGVPVVMLRNKIDLTGDMPGPVPGNQDVLNVSVKTGAGIDALKTTLANIAGYTDLGEGAFTARQRHIDALEAAKAHFERGCTALRESGAGELFAEELRLSQEALAAITGAFSSDDLLGRIFSEFCIGK